MSSKVDLLKSGSLFNQENTNSQASMSQPRIHEGGAVADA